MFLKFFFLFNVVKNIYNKQLFFNDNNYVFNNVSNIHFKYLEKYKSRELNINTNYKIKKNNNSVIENYYFTNNEFKKIRLSYFKSDDKEMFNSVWYPSYGYECPILSIDLIKFNEKNKICLVNLYEIYNTTEYHKKYIDIFSNIKNKYSYLYNNKSIHLNNFDKILSDSMLFTNKINDSIPFVIEDYLKIYLNNFLKKPTNLFILDDKHNEYNNIRKNIDNNFIPKYYIDDIWYKNYINYIYK